MGRKTDALMKGIRSAKSSVESLTLLKLTIARIKVVRNKRNISAQNLRKEIVNLIQSGQDAHVYITKADVLIKEENLVAAYDLIEQFCTSIIGRFPIIESQRSLPIDMKESIASLVYAAPRCTDLAELKVIKDMFVRKYGREFAASVNELRPDCGVSRVIIEKLTTRRATGEEKLKLMEEICKEQKIQWIPGEAITGSPSTRADEGSQQNEGSHLSTLGSTDATTTEGTAKSAQFGEVVTPINNNETDYSEDSAGLHSQEGIIFGQIGTPMTLQKENRESSLTREAASGQVPEDDQYNSPEYQLINVDLNTTKQMGLMEIDSNAEVASDVDTKIVYGLQQVGDDSQGVSTHSGNESYASAEGGGEEEGEIVERKTLSATVELKREDPLCSESSRVKKLDELEICEERLMKVKSLNANTMKKGSFGESQTMILEMVPEKATGSDALSIETANEVKPFQENEEMNCLSLRIEQIPHIQSNLGVQRQSESVSISGIPAEAMAVAAEAARLALIDYAKAYGSHIPESVNLNEVIEVMPKINLKLDQDGKHVDKADGEVSFEDNMEEKETRSSLKTSIVNKSDGDNNGIQNPAGTVITGEDINVEDYTWGDEDTNELSSDIPEFSSYITPDDEYVNSIFLRHTEARVAIDDNRFLNKKLIFHSETVDDYRKHAGSVHEKSPNFKKNSVSQVTGDVYESYKSAVTDKGSRSHKSKIFDGGSTSYKNRLPDEGLGLHTSTLFDEDSSYKGIKFDEGSTSDNNMIFDEGPKSFNNQLHHKGSECHNISFDLNDDLDDLSPVSDKIYEHMLYGDEGRKSLQSSAFNKVPMYEDIPHDKPNQYAAPYFDVEPLGETIEEEKLKIGEPMGKAHQNNHGILYDADVQSMMLGNNSEDKPPEEDRKYMGSTKPHSRRTKKTSTRTMTQLQHTIEEGNDMVSNDLLSGLKKNPYGVDDKVHVEPQSSNQREPHQDDTGCTLNQSKHRSSLMLDEVDRPLSSSAKKQVARKHQEHYESTESHPNRKLEHPNHEDGLLSRYRVSADLGLSQGNRNKQQWNHEEQYQNSQSRRNRRTLNHEEDLFSEQDSDERLSARYRTSIMSDDLEPPLSNRKPQQLKHQEQYQSPQSGPDFRKKPLVHGSDQLSYKPSMKLNEVIQPSANRRQKQAKHQEQYPSPQSLHNRGEKVVAHEKDIKSSWMGESESLLLDEVDPLSYKQRRQQPKYEEKYQSPQPGHIRMQQLPSNDEDTGHLSVLEPGIWLESEQKMPSRYKSSMQDEVSKPSSPNKRRLPKILDPQVERQEDIRVSYKASIEDDRNASPPLSNTRIKQKQQQESKEQDHEQDRLDVPIEQKPMKASLRVDDDEVWVHPRRKQEQADDKPNPDARGNRDHGQERPLGLQEERERKSSSQASRNSRKGMMNEDGVEEKPTQVEESTTPNARRGKQDAESTSSASVKKVFDTGSQAALASSSLESDPITLATIPPPSKRIGSSVSKLVGTTNPATTTTAATTTPKPPSIDLLAANFEAMRKKKLASGSN